MTDVVTPIFVAMVLGIVGWAWKAPTSYRAAFWHLLLIDIAVMMLFLGYAFGALDSFVRVRPLMTPEQVAQFRGEMAETVPRLLKVFGLGVLSIIAVIAMYYLPEIVNKHGIDRSQDHDDLGTHDDSK